MRKIFILLILLFSFCGCTDMSNTPIKKVEDLLTKYQTLDDSVISELDYSIEENNFTEEQKNRYREIIRNQYKNLIYEMKDETIDGNTASVNVEIQVFDYSKISSVATEFFKLNQDYFLDEDGIVDNSKYVDYKLKLMEDTHNKTKYTITFYLTKKKDIWVINEIDEITKQKIHGIYSYE